MVGRFASFWALSPWLVDGHLLSVSSRCLPSASVSKFPLPFFFFLSSVFFFRAVPTAYGGSQARGIIVDVAAGLRGWPSNVGS